MNPSARIQSGAPSAKLAWSIWALSTALLLAALVLTVANGYSSGWILVFGAVQMAFSSMGAVLASRLRGNPIGWLFLGFGALAVIAIAGEAYSLRALESGDPLPGGMAALVVSSAIYGPGLFAVVLTLFLVFPDGHLPSPRWRPVARVAVVAGGAFTVLQMIGPGTLNSLDPAQSVDSPIAVTGTHGSIVQVANGVCAVIVLTITVAAVVSLIRRYRGATGALRQQLKWFVGAAGFFMACLGCQAVLWQSSDQLAAAIVVVLFSAGVAALPLATGIAILRYRLYGIDVIIRKTLVYAALAATLALVYLGGISLLGWVFRSVTGQSGALAVTLSTLVVAAAFQPLRHRIQRAVDQRFYRRKYDAAETLRGFSSRLREQVDIDALNTEVLAVVSEALQPSHASLWLRRK